MAVFPLGRKRNRLSLWWSQILCAKWIVRANQRSRGQYDPSGKGLCHGGGFHDRTRAGGVGGGGLCVPILP